MAQQSAQRRAGAAQGDGGIDLRRLAAFASFGAIYTGQGVERVGYHGHHHGHHPHDVWFIHQKLNYNNNTQIYGYND